MLPGATNIKVSLKELLTFPGQVVELKVNEYDFSQSSVDLDFVDFGDAEVKLISEVSLILFL